jgi:hypothetical protein
VFLSVFKANEDAARHSDEDSKRIRYASEVKVADAIVHNRLQSECHNSIVSFLPVNECTGQEEDAVPSIVKRREDAEREVECDEQPRPRLIDDCPGFRSLLLQIDCRSSTLSFLVDDFVVLGRYPVVAAAFTDRGVRLHLLELISLAFGQILLGLRFCGRRFF